MIRVFEGSARRRGVTVCARAPGALHYHCLEHGYIMHFQRVCASGTRSVCFSKVKCPCVCAGVCASMWSSSLFPKCQMLSDVETVLNARADS